MFQINILFILDKNIPLCIAVFALDKDISLSLWYGFRQEQSSLSHFWFSLPRTRFADKTRRNTNDVDPGWSEKFLTYPTDPVLAEREWQNKVHPVSGVH